MSDVPPSPESTRATLLLNAAAGGDRSAANELLPLVYEQLRNAAHLEMAAERPDHTLSATALVHEAYLKLVGPREIPWAGRGHFYTAAAEAMRRILIDHARTKRAAKRGGGMAASERRPAVEIQDVVDLARIGDSEEILALDGAILRLEQEDAGAASVVRLRFYAGLTGEQAAAVLGISARQADREWAFARAFLLRELRVSAPR